MKTAVVTAPFTTIYIVRHGQSESNGNPSWLGTDPALTPLGREQIVAASAKLHHIQFDAIFSSDLKRALQSAEIYNRERQLAHSIHEILRERSFGRIFQSSDAKEQLEELHQKYISLSEAEKWTYRHTPEMETDEEAVTRFITFLREVAVAYAGKTILIIGHGNLMRDFLVKLGYATFAEIPPESLANAGTICVESDGVEFQVKEVTGLKRREKNEDRQLTTHNIQHTIPS